MELRQLRYVVAVAEEGTFTRAAARAHVAQPAISQQIAQIERELGARLFDRSPHGVGLTPAGEAFLPYARAALEAAAAGGDAVESLRGELAGELVVGTIPTPAEWLVRRLGRFRDRHPRVRITLRTGDPEVLADEVASGSLDAAVIGVTARRLPAGPAGKRLRAGLASQTIATEPLVVAVPPDHPLVGSAHAGVRDLRHEPLVTLVHGTGLRAVVESACAEAGFDPRIAIESDDLTVLTDLVARGLGVAVLPESTARRAVPAVTVLELRAPRLRRRMDLVWRRQSLSVPGGAFLDAVGVRDQASP